MIALLAVAFVASSGTLHSSNTLTTQANLTVASGDSLVAHVAFFDGSSNAVSTMLCNPGSVAMTIPPGGGPINDTTDGEFEATYVLLNATSITSCTMTTTVNSSYATVELLEYSGVAAFGNANTIWCSGTPTTCGLAITLQAANNFVSIGAQFQNYSAVNPPWSTGTGRVSCMDAATAGSDQCASTAFSSPKSFMIGGDNTSASTGALTTTVSSSPTTGTIVMSGVELCNTNPCAASTGPVPRGRRSMRGAGALDDTIWLYRREEEAC